MTARPLLLYGRPRLRTRSAEVAPGDADLARSIADLADTLAQFRDRSGWGRGISANQLGILKRIVVADLGQGPQALLNPKVVWAADEEVEYWDDCFSLPDVLVRVRRPRSISVEYQDEAFATHRLETLDWPAAELLHHEIDHLDGRLMVDRLVDRRFLVAREMRDEADRWLADLKAEPTGTT